MTNTEETLDERFERFDQELRHGERKTCYDTARTTACLLKDFVQESQWENAKELVEIIRRKWLPIIKAQQWESLVGNVVRRVLRIVRDDYADLRFNTEDEAKPTDDSIPHDLTHSFPQFKDIVNDSINELLEEIDKSVHGIACEAVNHINVGDVIMTMGKSNTVEKFLKAAAKKRNFQVLVVEGAPLFHGHELAASLADDNIETTVISDAAIFAMMPRVTKVIMGAQTILADGGLRAHIGSHIMGLAAKHYSVPFIVCSPLYKVSSNLYCPANREAFIEFGPPEDVARCGGGEELLPNTLIVNPKFDYVPRELVTLFICNVGSSTGTSVYRLNKDLYSLDDFNLCDDDDEEEAGASSEP